MTGAFREIRIRMFWRDGIDYIRHRVDADIACYVNLPGPAFELVPFFGDARLANTVGGHPLHEKPVHRARRQVESAEPAGIQSQWRMSDALAHELHPRPGIFFEFAHAFFQMRAGD